LPPGITLDPGAAFPPKWRPGDRLPATVTLDPKFGDQTYFDTARRKLSRF